MSGCDDPGAGEAAEADVGPRVVHGGVGGARAPGRGAAGAGGAGAGDAGPAVAVQPGEMSNTRRRQPGRHTAASALPRDELYVAAKPDGPSSGWSRAQRGFQGDPVGIHEPCQRAAQHTASGGQQTVRTMSV